MKNEAKLANAYGDIRHKCKCGHTVFIISKFDFVYCDWCGRKVFKNDKAKFKYKLLKNMGKIQTEQISQ